MSDSSDDEVYQQDEHHYDNDPDTEDEILPSDDGEDSYNGTDSEHDEEGYDDKGDGAQDDYDDDDGDDLVVKGSDKYSRFKIEKQKDDMASDIEDDDEEDYLPDSQAWGQDKKLYYNTDFVDKDYRSQKGKEEDLAKYEEEEALRIQKRMLGAFHKQAPQIDPFRVDQDYYSEEEDLKFNVTSMSAEEKRKLLQQESPELLFLIEKFEQYVNEMKDTLEPLIYGLSEKLSAPESSGLKYIKTRHAVLLTYTTNLSFYFSLMASDDKEIARNHPVMTILYQGQKLIEELDHAYLRNGKRLVKEIPFVMEALENGKTVQFLSSEALTQELSFGMKEDAKQKPGKGKQQVQEKVKDIYSDLDEDVDEVDVWPKDVEDEEGENDEENDEEKRAITYEMEKNKGLIPKRQKEQRNPRVKYRKKFEKAVVRRKGQVRAPRKEIKKYGGEQTGINARVVKSVRFK